MVDDVLVRVVGRLGNHFPSLGVDALSGIYPMAAASDGLDFWITVETDEGSALVRL